MSSNNISINNKVRTSASSPTLSHPTSSTSLLGRTRKISSDSTKARPLKRANSLTYRVSTPTQMVTSQETVSLGRSTVTMPKKIQTSFTTTSSSSSILPSPQSPPSPTSYVNKFRKRLRFLRRSPSTTSLSSVRKHSIEHPPSRLSSPIQSLKSENFTADNNNSLMRTGSSGNTKLISPPSSPMESSETETESDEFDTSCFSHYSLNHDTRESSFQFSNSTSVDSNLNNIVLNSSSCESSPISLNKIIPKFKFNYPNYAQKDILHDLTTSNSIDINLIDDEYANYANDINMIDDLSTLQRSNTTCSTQKQCHEIFEIPEILEIILRHVAHDYTETIPTEPKLNRRPPLSYNHSLMIYGEEQGKRVWKRTVSNSSMNLLNTRINSNTGIPRGQEINKKNPNLYNCLFVNKNWYFTMLSILNENLYFKTDSEFENFTSTLCTTNPITPEPFSLVLHKIKSPQSIMDIFATQISSRRLSWLEFYICPAILPPLDFISHSLKKLILPGCRALTDDHLKNLVIKAPELVHLDIRACDQITDASLYFIANNCPKLEMLNCGRHSRGELISDVSIGLIAKNCPIRTIGLAGCGISDWTIWELALHCGSTLERLSLNYCWKLSDVGICRVLKAGLLETLSVLEIRGVGLDDVRDVVHWKRRRLENTHKVLVEACENLDKMMKDVETQLDLEISARIFNDIDHWLQEDIEENGDVDYRQFLNERRRGVAIR